MHSSNGHSRSPAWLAKQIRLKTLSMIHRARSSHLGSAFSMALFKDYSYLARSFGTSGEPSAQSFDAAGSMSPGY